MGYQTVTVEGLCQEGAVDLYVYSTANNPDGAGEGTNAQYIGTTYNQEQTRGLWGAAVGAACAVYGPDGGNEIGLCIKVGE